MISDFCNETVIVGWYEHATVYRYFQKSIITPIYGIDRLYSCMAKAEDCYLLPESERNFRIGRASQDGIGKGFGQQNYWYAESQYAKNELIPKVLEFFETHKHERINLTKADFDVPENSLTPLNSEENMKADELFSNGDYHEFLPYGYRRYYATKSADAAFDIAEALSALHQYEATIRWRKKVIEIEGETWSNVSCLPYLYQQRGMYKESVDSAKNLLNFNESREEDVKHEIFGIIADSYFYLGNFAEAITWLDKIITESKNEALVKHTISVKEEWSQL